MENKSKQNDFCHCKSSHAVTTEQTMFGFWAICCACGKRIEDSFEYYNHYDGEDHVVDLY